ncbi:MAG TPA: hypothetical protein VF789_16195 [Thermoanaerobaculia bacterium]
MEKWEEKRILILGKTYPSYSKKYTENACTGGLLGDTLEMIRLHPIPYRYLEEGNRFSAFQWIRAKVTKHMSDPRPESYRIDDRDIKVEEVIPATEHRSRRRFLEKSPHLFRSLEELKDRQQREETSLGIVQPKEVIGCYLEKKSERERQEWLEKEREVLSQEVLFGEKMKPIDFVDVRFKVKWRCDDDSCQGHDMALLQWGIHELYRKLKSDPACEEKIINAMSRQLDLEERDVFFFLGSFRGVQYNFGLMDSYSPKRQVQPELF